LLDRFLFTRLRRLNNVSLLPNQDGFMLSFLFTRLRRLNNVSLLAYGKIKDV
jgi:hypothetical protein